MSIQKLCACGMPLTAARQLSILLAILEYWFLLLLLGQRQDKALTSHFACQRMSPNQGSNASSVVSALIVGSPLRAYHAASGERSS